MLAHTATLCFAVSSGSRGTGVAEDENQVEQQDQSAVLCIRGRVPCDLPSTAAGSRFLPNRNV